MEAATETRARTGWPGKRARTCSSTRPIPSTGIPGARRRFEAARASGKPILLSIGYSACHWCHVMAHESFEDAGHRGAHERAVREHQGRSRRAARHRQDLPVRAPGADAARRRLAADDVPDARRPEAVLRRHVFSRQGALRHAGVHHAAASAWRSTTASSATNCARRTTR